MPSAITNLFPINFLKSAKDERIVDFQLDFVYVHHFSSLKHWQSARVCFQFMFYGCLATIEKLPFPRINVFCSSTFVRHPSKQGNGFVTKPIGLFVT